MSRGGVKRRTLVAAKRAAKRNRIGRPSGESRYGSKHRLAEITKGYSTRPTSPFYLSDAELRRLRTAAKQKQSEQEA